MAAVSKRDALRLRVATMLVGVALCCVSVAGALRWIEISRTGNLVLGMTILMFVIIGWMLSRWLRSHALA